MGKQTAIPSRARQAVNKRDGGTVCARCGMHGSELHHRMRRREGKHALSVLVKLCGTCHREVHAEPAKSRRTGFIISAVQDVDPEAVPLKHFGGWVLYNNDGSITHLNEALHG